MLYLRHPRPNKCVSCVIHGNLELTKIIYRKVRHNMIFHRFKLFHNSLAYHYILVGWLCFMPHRLRGHLKIAPHLLSLAKDVKLGFYTVPTGNRTPGRRVAVHYTTAAPRQLLLYFDEIAADIDVIKQK